MGNIQCIDTFYGVQGEEGEDHHTLMLPPALDTVGLAFLFASGFRQLQLYK